MLRRLSVLAAAVLLAACTTPVPGATPSTAGSSPAPLPTSAGPVASPSPSASPTASPSPSASPTVRPSPTVSPGPAGPSVPPVAGALNVSARERADFASPTGRIWCGLSSSGALCHFPFGYTGTVPASEQVCPGEGLDVTGVAISETGVAYFCSGDPQSMPDRGTDGVAWHRNTGFGFVRFDGHTLAVLPYGKALRHGSRVCVSERVGVTCADTVTRHGFRVSRAAVQLF